MAHLWETGFSVRQPAWHGLATVIDDFPTDIAAARELAGATWEIAEEHPRYSRLTDDGVQTVEEVNWKRLFRTDTYATLGYARKTNEVIPVQDFFETLGVVTGAKDKIKIETAMVLDEGRKLAALAYHQDGYHIPGDPSPTMRYFTLIGKTDGSGAYKIGPTNVRVICANTANAAELEGRRSGNWFSIWHTRNWRDRRTEIAAAVQGSEIQHFKYQQLCEELTGISANTAQTEKFIEMYFPLPVGDADDDSRGQKIMRKNMEAKRDEMRFLTMSPTNEPIMGSAYGLLQLATEWSDHYRPFRSDENKMRIGMDRQLLRAQPLKQRAYNLALVATGRKPESFADKLSLTGL